MNAKRLASIHASMDEVTSSPWAHDVVELVMATAISTLFADQPNHALVWLLVEGNPSSGKTSTILTLGNDRRIIYVDNLTDNSLASGYVPKTKQARKPDLLRELERTRAVALVIKDLTSLLSGKDERVAAVLGDFNSIYDATFTKWTGTVGRLAYRTHFAIVAAVTPAAIVKHHRHLAKIGTRFLSYRIPSLTLELQQQGLGAGWVHDPQEHKTKIAALRQLVEEHVAALLDGPLPLVTVPEEHRAAIDQLARLLARGRGLVLWRRELWAEEIELVQVEEPFRAQAQLRTLAEALALVHGRAEVTAHEIELLRRVVLSSMPADRGQVVGLFPRHPEGLTVKDARAGIGLGDKRTRQLLDELKATGVVEGVKGESAVGAPPSVYYPVGDFAGLLAGSLGPLDHRGDLGDFSSQTPPRPMRKKKKYYTLGGVHEEKWGLLDLVPLPWPRKRRRVA